MGVGQFATMSEVVDVPPPPEFDGEKEGDVVTGQQVEGKEEGVVREEEQLLPRDTEVS